VVFKQLMHDAGVPQVEWEAMREQDDPAKLERLGLPVFVKPARLGSSVGISKVAAPGELRAALELAFRHDPLVIVEAMASGIEVECSVLGNDDPDASEPGQVVPKNEWYDYEAKYTEGGMQLVIPAPIDPSLRERVRDLAKKAFTAVDCAGLARVDFFVEGDEVLVNELNTMPGQTKTSVYGKLWEASGVGYTELMDRLVQLALERHEAERTYRF
jgi:D-alanine-D-alanine ligase